MAIKNSLSIKIIFILIMLAAIYSGAAAQEDARLTQRFSWVGGEYALRYEVIFERIENGVNIFALREFTVSHYIEVSLHPGEYRFRVIPYDILDRPAQGSDWRYIEILRIPEPETEEEIFSEPHEPHEPYEPEQVIVQEEEEIYTESEPEPEPVTPFWEIFDDLEKTITSFGTQIAIMLPYYGEAFAPNALSMGFGLTMSITFLIPANIYIGPEATVFMNTGDEIFAAAGLKLLVMKWMANERSALGFKIGAYYPAIYSGESNIIASAGLSYHWRLLNRVVFEIGVDFFHIFEDPSSGSIRPWLGLSYHF